MTLGLFLSIALLLQSPSATSASRYNVVKFGATSDGSRDSSYAMSRAWNGACQSYEASTIVVPRGKFLIKGNVNFQGPCNNNRITIRIRGTVVAPSSFRDGYWLSLEGVDGVTILGGVLDGCGSTLWGCKNSHGDCSVGATSLGITNSRNVEVIGLKSLNSQLFHIVVNGCENVKLQGVRITAAGESPNTDGIHIQYSTGITVIGAEIATGDDCVSIGPNSTNLWIEQVKCGPGHGISIGSLGVAYDEPGVQNVTVKDVEFYDTQNGLRIKTWARPSTAFVRSVMFQGAEMYNVCNPILIDQNYCPDNKDCPGKESGVQISDITYQDIRGTSATEVAVNFECSSEKPCQKISVHNINLRYGNDEAKPSCSNAEGSASGVVKPAPSCLSRT